MNLYILKFNIQEDRYTGKHWIRTWVRHTYFGYSFRNFFMKRITPWLSWLNKTSKQQFSW